MTAKSSDWRPGPSVCRCCFAEGCYKDISTEYFWMGKREVYQEMLSTTFDVSISYAQSGGPNSNSRLICEPCIARLRDASDFKRQVQECERVFHQHLDPTSSVSELEVVVEPPGKEVKLERVKVESKLSDDEDFDDHAFVDDDDDDLDDQPLTALATKVPKKESVDLMDLLDNAKPEKRKAAAKPKTPPAKKAKKKESPKPSASKPAPKPVEKKRKGEEVLGNQKIQNRLRKYIPRQNAKAVLQYSTVYPFRLWNGVMVCIYCLEQHEDPDEYRRHIDTEHPDANVSVAYAHCRTRQLMKVDCTNLKCRICSEPFETIEEAAKHIKINHDCPNIDLTHDVAMQPYKLVKGRLACVLCGKKFPTLATLNRHMNSHNYKYTCDVCGKCFLDNTQLKRHVLFRHSGKYMCSKCNQEFPNAIVKLDHVKSCRGNYVVCVTCGISVISHEVLEKHNEEVHGIPKKLHCCQECGEKFDTKKAYFKHYRLYHPDECYTCDCCGLQFEKKSKLEEHVLRRAGVRPQCKVCRKQFELSASLVRHVKRYHPEMLPVEAHTPVKCLPDRVFQCDICSKSFPLKKRLIGHMWTHSDKKKYSCPACKKQLSQKSSLIRHMKAFHPQDEERWRGVKKFYCDICVRSFDSVAYLNRHKKIHSENKQMFPCDICNKQFSARNSMQLHRKTVCLKKLAIQSISNLQ